MLALILTNSEWGPRQARRGRWQSIHGHFSAAGKWIATVLALVALTFAARAGGSRTQSVQLKPGWNAVFLEVQPAAATPGELFAGLPVTAVACFIPGSLQEQYLRTPGDAPWKEEGWAVWYAPTLPQAFLSNLYELKSHRAYLIKATAPCACEVTGEASALPIQWYPNTCTLTGLPVDAVAPPTFAEFFAGSEAHQRLRIYRLEDSSWKLVRDPATTRARRGEAVWVQTDGASTYQGPVRMKLEATGQIDFGSLAGQKTVEIINEGTSGAQIQIESIAESAGLPLGTLETDLGQRTSQFRPLPALLALPTMPAGAGTMLRLALDRTSLAGSGTTLLRVTDGRGTQYWVPVKARDASAQ